jgi:hypothetical protein
LKGELKQEAIKWVKYYKLRRLKTPERAFMAFFNLTEEDLKNDLQM